jgi:hypothetical protein
MRHLQLYLAQGKTVVTRENGYRRDVARLMVLNWDSMCRIPRMRLGGVFSLGLGHVAAPECL